ncbi:tRNA uridine-5-carboxymethylaminomethyl(34) synthesis GTPase MnmE [Roseimicrobium sp. ORNL1]|uniref:tRNA uridine-5-carboxymethylaminomethyl(34) synthesis GTPase MnmE n=1 Tax=Roseimicrobium sp. ORNL1 TaxID=2711231 RepID=UPI0013E10228|nr:tRNA uridine-5-carboxymethylaminomethyl(34) synthesis GTPase MnmE [Roseimicrobium sp. ORNL1]QIF02585.1 tRNA uridine-5-carboxymethylaminomethyl(34) synthesis GTPase MnmE [Roseimicrobium sp. ORNL1]
MTDTIAAISTAFGEAAISVLRVSGPEAVRVGDNIFRGKSPVPELSPRMQHLGRIVDANDATVDSVLLTVFRGPASYTGEDMVEISCHGGVLVTRRIYELLLANGARAAEPGEFTQRAFLNGKLDLTQAEAVMDLIHAQSELALQAASQQLEGRLGHTAEQMREDLIHLLAHLEAYIDFPEEDIDPDTGDAMLKRMEALQSTLRSLLDTAEHGRILRSGARTVICGEPNVGKSSLLNLLTGFERAIVSPQAGTTRDTIEEVLHIHGLPFRLVDTAGLRQHTSDFIEQHGMERTRKELAQADVILEVVDGSKPQAEAHRVPIPAGREKAHVVILNKADLGIHDSWSSAPAVALSCASAQGVEALRNAMRDAVWSGAVSGNAQLVAINARHKACFERAAAALREAAETFRAGTGTEFVALHVREAMQSIGEVTGRVDVEEVLGAIFSTFCIGK